MDPSTDQSEHLVQDVSSGPQESSASLAHPEEPSAVSCDTNETDPSQDSKPIDAHVVDPTTDVSSSQPADKSVESAQSAEVVAQQLKFGPCSKRFWPYPRLSREVLREIAASTLDALDDGFYYPPATGDAGLIDVEQTGTEKEGEETEAETTMEEESKGGEGEVREGEKESNGVEEGSKKREESKGGEEESENEGKGGEKEGGGDEESKGEEESKEGGNGECEKGDKQSEVEVGTADENSQSEEVKMPIADHRKAGRKPYDLKTKMWNTNVHTLFIAPEDETISLWFKTEKGEEGEKKNSRILIGEYSTLFGCRRLKGITQDEAGPKGKIGVLNFASAKKPGGGFLNGSQAQEESLARSGTLYPSLLTTTAKHFYRLYSADPDNAFYTHAMVYSPSVILFREDNGDWTAPVEVDILTCAAVNAGDVRKQVRWEEEMRELRERVRVAELARRRELSLPTYIPTQVRIYEAEPQKDDGAESGHPPCLSEQPTSVQVSPIIFASDPPSPPLEPLALPGSQNLGVTSTVPSHSPSSPYPHPPNVDPFSHAENLIAAAMHERIARILYLFQLQGAKHLVLGSFGTGVFQNSVRLVAGIFRDLLCEPEDEKGKEEEKEGESDEGETSTFVSGVSSQGKGRFKGVFDTVMFAILGGSTVEVFKDVFEGAEGVEFDEEEDSDVDGVKDTVRDTCEPPA